MATKKRPRDSYWFRCIRKAFGISQAMVAKLSGITNATVSNYETGNAKVDQEIINTIHWALITLVHKKEKTIGEERCKILMDIAKLDYSQYYEDYSKFVIAVWAMDSDMSTLDEALVWNGLGKEGDII